MGGGSVPANVLSGLASGRDHLNYEEQERNRSGFSSSSVVGDVGPPRED